MDGGEKCREDAKEEQGLVEWVESNENHSICLKFDRVYALPRTKAKQLSCLNSHVKISKLATR